ncbi:MAG: histidinol-phosphate transaminase [Candidatus Omnitrophota bacterium]
MTILARNKIKDLKPYEPGKPIKELSREFGIKESDIIKLASNENPLGPSPKALKAIIKAAAEVNRYPDGSSFYLKKKLAENLKTKPENLVFGNGSDELIEVIIKAFLEEDEEVIISEPAFLEYSILVKTRGSKVKTVPALGPDYLREQLGSKVFEYDLKGILSAITSKTKIIFLGNPDNPTGAYLNEKELDFFLKKCPKKVIVVFDEAYREFVDWPDYSNPFNYIDNKNVIVLRTFSKVYGLAGLRVGYAIADKELAAYMERVRQPFNVNLLAQAAAEAAISDKAHLKNTQKLVKEEKEIMETSLKQMGMDVIITPANFLLFSCAGLKGTDIFKKLLKYGVIIRDMKAYGLKKWVRVNIGTQSENKRFLETLSLIIKKS